MSPLPIVTQVSAGGVAFRQIEGRIEVALILVGPLFTLAAAKRHDQPG